ncbi:related to long-chain-fatty-acid--CoA ligase [Desulfotalea psychrophila LSv54]|uniref:Related to long-chain-fatty-acid--CoA ligase n=2 Tax=Desulfotalea psychrophila TaxID=84980 RepID=Q6AS79_DESPS|nr:related to long-chain-fatty-acid--CoA ligase [Desulfotalea psychrophila LSv54]
MTVGPWLSFLPVRWCSMNAGEELSMTLNHLVDMSCEKFAALPAIGMAMAHPLTYEEMQRRIIALAASLQAEGIKKGGRIAILAENSDRWGVVYLAAVRIGAIVVPILPDLPESDVHHILSEMKVGALFITHRQLEKVYDFSGSFPELVVTLDDSDSFAEVFTVTSYSTYLENALEGLQGQEGAPHFPEVEEDDIASILYTSGTSGYSKAVMLSHGNFSANAHAASELAEIEPGAVWLSILPISHTYEFTCGFILPLLCGARIAYAGKTPTPAILQKLCQHERPFAIFAVPLVLEKIYKKRVLPQIEKSKLLTLICKTSLGRNFIYKRIGRKLIEFFGGNLGIMGIGGAALNPEVAQFLTDAQFPYLIGYGMTEAAPLIAGGPLGDKTIATGSTGKPLPGVQVKIVDGDAETGVGEILARGPNVMQGYYNDREESGRVLSEDGWLSTGDLGRLDAAGNLHISGRLKNVIVMANGENVYPEVIEHKINSFLWVVESLLLEKENGLEASVYPDYEYVDEQTNGQSGEERRRFIEHLLEEMRIEVNATLSRSSHIARIFERREPFTKTATHKIKRYLYDT